MNTYGVYTVAGIKIGIYPFDQLYNWLQAGYEILLSSGASTHLVDKSTIQSYLDHNWTYVIDNENQGTNIMTDKQKLLEELSAFSPAEVDATMNGNPPQNVIDFLQSSGLQNLYQTVIGKPLISSIVPSSVSENSSLWIIGLFIVGMFLLSGNSRE